MYHKLVYDTSMPHVSRNKLDLKAEQKLIQILDLVLTKIQREEQINEFLVALLTPTERIMLAKRLAIIILLKEGLPESQIAETLHVTRVTVSRLQFFLESRGTGYRIALEVLKNEKVMDEAKILLLKLATYAAKAGRGHA